MLCMCVPSILGRFTEGSEQGAAGGRCSCSPTECGGCPSETGDPLRHAGRTKDIDDQGNMMSSRLRIKHKLKLKTRDKRGLKLRKNHLSSSLQLSVCSLLSGKCRPVWAKDQYAVERCLFFSGCKFRLKTHVILLL